MADYLIEDLNPTAGLTSSHIIEVEEPSSNLSEKATLAQLAAFIVSVSNVMRLIGPIDCSANPNYSAADNGDIYRVSVAGKIGGASGPNVEVGDMLICFVDGSAAGTHAAVGANWIIEQSNLDGVYYAGGTDVAVADGGTGASTASGARTNLGVAIGSDVQAYDADLAALAALSSTGYLKRTGAGTATADDIPASDLPLAPVIATPAYAATLTFDLSTIRDCGIIRVNLTGNITIQLSNGTDGQKFMFELTQDGTGSRLVTLSGTYFRFCTDITGFTATTTASKTDRIGCIYNAAAGKADVIAVAKGY